MSMNVRQKLGDVLARLIAERPTMSVNCAVDFANELLKEVQPEILRSPRPLNFNFNRKSISLKVIETGLKVKEANIKAFKTALPNATIIFDHWSRHGKNFFGAIARFVDHE